MSTAELLHEGHQTEDASQYSHYLRLDTHNTSSDTDSSDSSSGEDDDEDQLPISHEYHLPSTTSSNVLSFSCSGDSLFSGTSNALNLYEFDHLNSKSTAPSQAISFDNGVQSLTVSKTHGSVIALSNNPVIRLLDVNGEQIWNSMIGDKSIQDLKHTYGHTDIVTSASWQQPDEEQFVTASKDGTFRIWSNIKQKQITVGLVKRNSKRTAVSHVTYVGDYIVTADTDRLLLWDPKLLQRPIAEVFAVSAINTLIPLTEHHVLVRTSTDLKMYDIRKFQAPIIQRLNFPSSNSHSPISQNGEYILAETSISQDITSINTSCSLHILDSSSLQTIHHITFPTVITGLAWSPTTNQIAVAHGSNISILFDPGLSKSGVMTTIHNKSRLERKDVIIGSQVGYNTEELEALKRTRSRTVKDVAIKKQKMVWGTTQPKT